MRPIFDNGATRARALAWGVWLLFAATATGLAFASGERSGRAGLLLAAALGLGGRLILVRTLPCKIPVLDYHSVSARPEWTGMADRVSLTPDGFERQLAYLKRLGYRGVFVSEVSERLAGRGAPEPGARCVALTFDDGYADFWIAVFPLLKKYGMKATLFVSTAFISSAEGCRPAIEPGAAGREDAIDWTGYLTWPELEVLRDSGLVEIQSHGHAHGRVFTGPRIEGFVGPGKPNRWLLWERRPEARARWWREIDRDRSLWGHPVFRQGPALVHRAYRPDPEAVESLRSWIRGAGRGVFGGPRWERRLRAEWERQSPPGSAGRGKMESAREYETRVAADLAEARWTLKHRLGSEARILCWPENAFSADGERIARELGYSVTVSNRHGVRNAVGEAPDRIVRVFVGSRAAGIASPRLDFLAFVLELKVFEGWYAGYPPLAAMHLARKAYFRVRRIVS